MLLCELTIIAGAYLSVLRELAKLDSYQVKLSAPKPLVLFNHRLPQMDTDIGGSLAGGLIGTKSSWGYSCICGLNKL